MMCKTVSCVRGSSVGTSQSTEAAHRFADPFKGWMLYLELTQPEVPFKYPPLRDPTISDTTCNTLHKC